MIAKVGNKFGVGNDFWFSIQNDWLVSPACVQSTVFPFTHAFVIRVIFSIFFFSLSFLVHVLIAWKTSTIVRNENSVAAARRIMSIYYSIPQR